MRERARDEAAVYLNECRKILAAAEAELEKRERTVENCRNDQHELQKQLLEKSGDGIKTGEILRFRQYLVDLRELEARLLKTVEEQKRIVERHAQTVEKALAALRDAALETKVIEKHRENWTSSKKLETERREQKTNDEISAILHERQKLKS